MSFFTEFVLGLLAVALGISAVAGWFILSDPDSKARFQHSVKQFLSSASGKMMLFMLIIGLVTVALMCWVSERMQPF